MIINKYTFVVLLLLLLPTFAIAESNQTDDLVIHYFYRTGCPYCAQQEAFFTELLREYPDIEIIKYDITQRGSLDELDRLAEKYNITIERVGVPMTFIQEEFFFGYSPLVGDQISAIVRGELGEPREGQTYLPFIGVIDTTGYSLAVLAVLIGFLDGMNVCSIGALLLILAIVIKFNSRKRILFYGGLFILTTAIVYGLLVFAWYGAIRSLIAYISFMEILIGLVAIGGGIYFLRKFFLFYKYGPGCEVTSNKFIVRLQKKMHKVIGDPETHIFAIGGMLILFAAVVTIIELPCSFALPLIFSGILADSGVSAGVSAIYILLYLFVYMSIEIAIFLTAVFTKKIWYGPDTAVTWVTLLAALVLLALGFYYLL